MGTRSTVTFVDEDDEIILRLYRQFDGYPEGMGVDLADLLIDMKVGNGITGDWMADPNDTPELREMKAAVYRRRYANGIHELACHVLVGLKLASPIGNVYVHSPKPDLEGEEYNYTIKVREDGQPLLTCDRVTASLQLPKAWLKRFKKKAA